MENVENVATQEATETTPETAVVVERKKRNSPDAITFVRVWNESESRNDVVARLTNLGYTPTYSAVVARATQYKEKGYDLKEMTPGSRGRRLESAEAFNAKLKAEAVPAEVLA